MAVSSTTLLLSMVTATQYFVMALCVLLMLSASLVVKWKSVLLLTMHLVLLHLLVKAVSDLTIQYVYDRCYKHILYICSCTI